MVKLYVGVDESNNGKEVAIYTAARSFLEEDSRIERPLDTGKGKTYQFSKARSEEAVAKLLSQKLNIKYSYTLTPKIFRKIYPEKGFGLIVTSLLKGVVLPEIDELQLLMDGTLAKKQTHYARDLLAEVLGLDKEGVTIYGEEDLDRKCKLVNLADTKAYDLYTKPLKQITADSSKERAILLERKDLELLIRRKKRTLLEGIL